MTNTSPFLHFLVADILGVLGIIVWHLQGPRRPMPRLVVQIIFFAMMTLVMVSGKILPHTVATDDGDGGQFILGASSRILWWVHLAWASIGIVRLYIVLDHRPQEARLIQDLIVSGVYLGVALGLAAFVFGAPIGTLVATSGAVAIVLGLALQNTLADLFSGIALTLGRPFSIGDWIQLADGTEGRVVQNSWRSTQILTAANNVIVLPNSTLAKLGLTNISRPDEAHLIVLTIRIAALHRPSEVEAILKTALEGCKCIVHTPPPVVAMKGIDLAAIDVELQFRVANPAGRTPARNEIIDIIHQSCTASKIDLALPAQSYLLYRNRQQEDEGTSRRLCPT